MRICETLRIISGYDLDKNFSKKVQENVHVALLKYWIEIKIKPISLEAHKYLFWAILGFIIHFYGTNLLTGGPAQICCFIPISVFWRKGISDGVETERNQLEKLFLEGNTPDGLGPHVRRYGSSPRGWGARPPPRAHPLPRGAPVAPLTCFFCLYNSTYPKTSGTQDRSGVPPPEAFVATKSQSGPCSGTLPEGGSLTGDHHLHHPGALHDKEGVVHPRGWGYVPVAMCLISLSLVFLIWHGLDVSRALLL